MSITEFTEDKYYVLSGNGEKWEDYDGPFNSAREGVAHLGQLCGEWASPEIINSATLTYFKDNVLHLAKDDNGRIINGKQIAWKNSIWMNGELIFHYCQIHNNPEIKLNSIWTQYEIDKMVENSDYDVHLMGKAIEHYAKGNAFNPETVLTTIKSFREILDDLEQKIKGVVPVTGEPK